MEISTPPETVKKVGDQGRPPTNPARPDLHRPGCSQEMSGKQKEGSFGNWSFFFGSVKRVVQRFERNKAMRSSKSWGENKKISPRLGSGDSLGTLPCGSSMKVAVLARPTTTTKPTIPDVASTIPSDTPNFISLGMRFAITITCLSKRSSGEYDFFIPAKTVLVSSPRFIRSFNIFLESSTSSASTIVPILKSSFIKSSSFTYEK